MLDFDELKELAKDPERIEEYRDKVIEDFISTLPEDRQHRARQFQFRIMAETRHIKDPMARATAMYDKMIESMCLLHGVMNGRAPEEKPKMEADILKFRQEKLDKDESD